MFRYFSLLNFVINNFDSPILRSIRTLKNNVMRTIARLIFIFFLLVLFWVALQGYKFDWTGFENKKLWDWLELLIIPIILSGGIFFLNNSERKNEREIALDKQHEAIFQNYISRMSDLLIHNKLRTTKAKEVRDVARTLTLSTLRGLDSKRKGFLLSFLQEAKLIENPKPVINLKGADLRNSDLKELNLQGINLEYAVLENAKLFSANLMNANLNNANLMSSDLSGSSLNYCSLRNVNMSNARMIVTDLSNSNLSTANLSGAKIIGVIWKDAILDHANLKGAKGYTKHEFWEVKSLKGTIMPNQTVHD